MVSSEEKGRGNKKQNKVKQPGGDMNFKTQEQF